jgi:hypothetical protein
MRALGLSAGDYVTFVIDGADVRIQKIRWVADRR